jgi:colanic acid/amylovoran biosynthesis glycosyltransferase
LNARGRRPLHLLEVDLNWPPETFLQWKLQALAAHGLRVTVAGRSAQHSREPRLKGVDLIRLPTWGERRRQRLLEALGRARLSRLRPDVVQFEWESAAVYWLPLYDRWGAPVVVSCHGGGLNVHPRTGSSERVVREYPTVFRRAAAVHVVSEALAKEASRYGVAPERTWLIRPAVDPDVFRPDPSAARPDDVLRVVAIGELIWRKGYDYALQAVRVLVDAGIELRFDILGGEPPPGGAMRSDRPRILYTIHDLGLSEQVRLHGEVSSAEVRRLLQGADVLLHSAVSEGIPVAVLEAMSCRVPVVVTDAGGTREAVRDGVEGFVVPPREPAELARRLRTLAEDDALRKRLGAAGRERVLAHFTLAQQTRSYLELYEAVAGRADH